jgi:hypothetical protein
MTTNTHLSAEGDGFGQQIKEAVRKKLEPAQKAREKEQERWREAESKPVPPPPPKS